MAYSQSKSARMDESLGMRRGKESSKKQSYKSRRDESMGMKAKNYGNGFNLKDGSESGDVKNVPTNSEQYDMERVKPYQCGSKGYPKEAWNYKF